MGWLKETAIKMAFGAYNAMARKLPLSRSLPEEPFAALNEFFDARLVLSIQRNQDRQASVREQLHGLDFQFFWGVDGKALEKNDPRYDLARAVMLNGRDVHVNELACTMSHLAIFRWMMEKGFRNVLVLEDDAVPIRRHSSWVSRCLSSLPDDWELFYLGYRDGELKGFAREAQDSSGGVMTAQKLFPEALERGSGPQRCTISPMPTQ